MRFLLFFVFSLLSLASFAEKGDMWEVSDADLTVWDSPNYLNKLGMMHQGDTFEEEGMDGDMIKFIYKGKTAYVASYCCKRFEPEPDSDVDEEGETETATQEVEETMQAPKGQSDNPKVVASNKKDSAQVAPQADVNQQSEKEQGWGTLLMLLVGVLGLLGTVLGLIAVVFTFFYVFKYQTLAKWMNEKCAQDVIPYTRLNKLLLYPVLAALGSVVATVLAGFLVSGAEQGSDTQMAYGVLGMVLTIGIPILILWYRFRKDKTQYGKKAALWRMAYSLLSIAAIYLVCVVIAYIVMGIVAVLIFALIFALAFPTRYYIVRKDSWL